MDGIQLQPGDVPEFPFQIIPGMEGVAMALFFSIVLCVVVLAWRK